MKLEFSNLHVDGEIRSRSDVLLQIVGDFALWVGDRLIYREVEFCLMEFAGALASWLAMATDVGPDFVYTSLESETVGLVRFTRLNPGMWRVSAADQDQPAEDSVTTSELKSAGITFIRELRAQLQPKWNVLQ